MGYSAVHSELSVEQIDTGKMTEWRVEEEMCISWTYNLHECIDFGGL